MFSVEYCKTKAGFEIKPTKKVTMNFEHIQNRYEILVSTPHVCVIRVGVFEVIVHSHGVINFKQKITKEEATIIGEMIYSL